MFIPFSLNINEIEKLHHLLFLCKIDLKERKKATHEFLKSKIDIKTGILKGDEIKRSWLPIDTHYNFFISYSHNDEKQAIKLVQWLETKGLKCFLDACYWNSADELLKEIDNEYCKQDNGYYSYTKRNYSTSLVHSLLSMAILEVIDKSDFAIFIESNNSLDMDFEDIKKCTLSPWLYQEASFIKNIQKRKPSWLKHQLKFFSDGGRIDENNQNLKMSFTMPSFISLQADQLNRIKGKNVEWLYEFVNQY